MRRPIIGPTHQAAAAHTEKPAAARPCRWPSAARCSAPPGCRLRYGPAAPPGPNASGSHELRQQLRDGPGGADPALLPWAFLLLTDDEQHAWWRRTRPVSDMPAG
jgi:hypothetical protein